MRPTPKRSSVSRSWRPSSRVSRSPAWTFSQTGSNFRSEKRTIRAPPSDRLVGLTLPSGSGASQGTQAHRQGFHDAGPPGQGEERRRRSWRWIRRPSWRMGKPTTPDATAKAEVRRADRGDQDDGQARAAQEPAFDQQALERLVVERAPAVVAHSVVPPELRFGWYLIVVSAQQLRAVNPLAGGRR